MACNVTVNELLHRYFSKIFTANSTWKLSEKLFLRTHFLQELLKWLFRSKASTGSCSGINSVVKCVFLWEVKVFKMFCWKRRPNGKVMNLFLANLDSLEKQPVLVSAKFTWKKSLTKEHDPAAAFVYNNKCCVSWYGKNMNKIKISIFVPPLFLLWYPLVQYFKWNQRHNRGMHRAIGFGNPPSAGHHCFYENK